MRVHIVVNKEVSEMLDQIIELRRKDKPYLTSNRKSVVSELIAETHKTEVCKASP